MSPAGKLVPPGLGISFCVAVVGATAGVVEYQYAPTPITIISAASVHIMVEVFMLKAYHFVSALPRGSANRPFGPGGS